MQTTRPDVEEAKTRNNSPSMVKQHRLRGSGEIDLRTSMVIDNLLSVFLAPALDGGVGMGEQTLEVVVGLSCPRGTFIVAVVVFVRKGPGQREGGEREKGRRIGKEK